MKRREFLKTGAVAAGTVGSLKLASTLTAAESGAPAGDNRPSEYLRRAQGERFLPPPPAFARTYPVSPMPLAERLRRKVVPERGLCSLAPAELVRDTLTTGNGPMNLELLGEPYTEQILFHHESLLLPWKRPLEAANVADLFPQVRQMAIEGNRDALAPALRRMSEGPFKPNTEPHRMIPAFLMQLELPKTAAVTNYLRTVNFESGELQVIWSDERGDWARRTFASRPDNVVVQQLTAPAGRTMSVRIALQKSGEWTMTSGTSWGNRPARGPIKGPEVCDARQETTEQRLVYQCVLDRSVDNSGYVGVTRVVRTGGSARVDGGALVIENATSVLLLTRIEYFAEMSDDRAAALTRQVDQIAPDYAALLARQQKVQAEMFGRVTFDLDSAEQRGLAVEELLSDQRSRPDFSPALLEQVFQMGRHWFIQTSGKYPNIPGAAPFTVDMQTPGLEPPDVRRGEETRPAGIGLLQMAGAVPGNLREGLEAYFNWIESLAADARTNAKNIFGCRGTSYALWPQPGMGVKYYYTPTAIGSLWPFWISGGGIAYRPFWDHYLATGDLDFLRRRVVPGLKDLALFYEDFLTATDKNGNYVFAPSFSPETTPTNSEPSGPTLVNATMDIAVCREVLGNLIEACETLGVEADGVAKWKAMLAKLPPYLLEPDGTLKEWAWPTVQERFNHRHASHLYTTWPGDEIDPDRTPQLARAAEIANRRRTFDILGTSVSGETLPAFARCHWALAATRLKDRLLAATQLRQLLEQGYLGAGLRTSRDPYAGPVPEALAGIPALLMEMLVYSRPGVIEVLPALPPSLAKGTIKGMLTRTTARLDELAWDTAARRVDLKITSTRKQDITLIARQGIEKISGPQGVVATTMKPGAADCELRLPAGQSVEIHFTLGRRDPSDWVLRA